ncbi:MAG: hypothetical protein AAB445_04085 [Patescibacteria group bacterium]
MKPQLPRKLYPFVVLGVSVLVLIGNQFALHSPLVGLIFFCLYFLSHGWVASRYSPIRSARSVKVTFGILSVFATHIFAMLPFYYFYRLNDLTQATAFIAALALTLGMYWYWSRTYIATSEEASVERSPSQSYLLQGRTIWLLTILGFTCVGLVGYYLYRIAQAPHLYTGSLATVVPITVVVLFAFVSYLFAVFGRSLHALFFIIVATLAFTLTFTFAVDNLYGADSWRHVGIAEQVVQGQVYEPTNFQTLVQFSSEKVPNASLYVVLPFFAYWTKLSVTTAFTGLSIFLPGLLAVLLYAAGLDLSRNKRSAALMALAGSLAAFYLSLDPALNVRSLGIAALLLTSWLWIRYLLHRDVKISFIHIIIGLLALAAYPTTGFICGVVILLAYLLRRYTFRRLTFPIVICAGLLFAAVIPMLDYFLQHAQVTNAFQENAVYVFTSSGRNWIASLLTLRTFSGILTLSMIASLVWLYYSYRNVFILAATVSFALAVDVIALSIFKDAYVPFTSRVPFIFDATRALLAGLSLALAVHWAIRKRERIVVIALGVLTSVLIATLTSPSKYHFGWSVSNVELQAIHYINSDAQAATASYVVLTDEVTSAAGFASSGNRYAYYWYPNGSLYAFYQAFVTNPSARVIQEICSTYAVNRVYFLKTPIPLTSDMDSNKQMQLRQIFQVEHNLSQNVSVLRTSCPTTQSI